MKKEREFDAYFKKFAAVTMSFGLAVAGLTGVSAMSDTATPAAEAAVYVISPRCKGGGRYARNVGAPGRYVQYREVLKKKNNTNYWRNYNKSTYRSIFWSAPWNTPGTAWMDAGTTCFSSGWDLRY